MESQKGKKKARTSFDQPSASSPMIENVVQSVTQSEHTHSAFLTRSHTSDNVDTLSNRPAPKEHLLKNTQISNTFFQRSLTYSSATQIDAANSLSTSTLSVYINLLTFIHLRSRFSN